MHNQTFYNDTIFLGAPENILLAYKVLYDNFYIFIKTNKIEY